MHDTSESNGHHSGNGEESRRRSNPYLDGTTEERPPELARFDLNTDPYANIIPRVDALAHEPSDDETTAKRRPHPLTVAVSLLLVAVLVLPVMVQVFARLLH